MPDRRRPEYECGYAGDVGCRELVIMLLVLGALCFLVEWPL